MSEDTRFTDLSDTLKLSKGSAGHIAIFNLIANQLITYHCNQEQTYELSFSKRGEIGVWMNLGRKVDRLDPIAKNLFSEEGNRHPLLVDVLVDMAIYAVKWLAVIYEIRPEDLQNWVATTYATAMHVPPEHALEWFKLEDVPVTNPDDFAPDNPSRYQLLHPLSGDIDEVEAVKEEMFSAFEAYAFQLNKEVQQLSDEEKRKVLDMYFQVTTGIINEEEPGIDTRSAVTNELTRMITEAAKDEDREEL
ncbi:hypothetical protein LCGC14_0506670 [marine sediment metagenome]|uniref:Uncharacterized protein n=1 Tax=marine sediment metagenome TaxID=412755 RepID=A0A0F9SKS1_9ZZZZ